MGRAPRAIRKGQTYAAIVVDLETRRPIELLANAEVKTVETWFKEHPDIKIVSRDRDTMFAWSATLRLHEEEHPRPIGGIYSKI